MQKLIPLDGIGESELLEIAASAELRSEHPLGKAIVAYAVARESSPREPERFEYTPGLGITATVDGATILVGNRTLLKEKGVVVPERASDISAIGTEVFVSRAGRFLGTIIVADTVRPEARAAISSLRAMHIRPILLTGDARPVAAIVAPRT